MQDIYEILLLSIIQGFTEFLPVSSSAHIIALSNFINFKSNGIEFEIILHGGTLFSIVVHFRKEIKNIIEEFIVFLLKLKKKNNQSNSPFIFKVIISTIPIVVTGLLVKQFTHYIRCPKIIAYTSVIFGILLYKVDLFCLQNKSIRSITHKEALLIGIFQIISLIPGVSRSGICITIMRLLRFNRNDCVKYTFLLAIPTILGANILILFEAFNSSKLSLSFFTQSYLFVGVLLSFIFGIIAIRFMFFIVKRYSFLVFLIYRIFLSIIIYLYYCIY